MQKPPKTLADYLVVAISPVLIMVLVGSLAFFLIQVFYHGAMIHGIRWLMFWFVLAIVLISRVAIEQGRGYARFYGVALAVATWFYLTYTHKSSVFGIILLGITWWCAHVLTKDCTLIREDEDASGEGVLRGLWNQFEDSLVPTRPPPEPPPLSALERLAVAELAKQSRKPARPPGRSVVYFSLAALPLFGIGQLLLPENDPHARRVGFAFLAVYLTAALSLLMTTSFLGLRRYLRQRSVEMPGNVTFGWIKFGAVLVGCVLLAALILPRPDGYRKKPKDLTQEIEPKEHKASDYALPFNSPGEGEGTPAEYPVERNSPGVDSKKAPPGNGTQNSGNENRQSNPRSQPDRPAQTENGTGAGNRGPAGQGNPSPDRTENEDPQRPAQPFRFKDVVPNGQSDQPSEQNQGGGGGGSDSHEPNRGGAERPPIQGETSHQTNQPGKQTTEPSQQKTSPAKRDQPPQREQQPEEQPDNPTGGEKPPSKILYNLLRALVILALATLLIWAVIRYRKVIAQMMRSFIAAIREFFRKLFSFRWRRRHAAVDAEVEVPDPVLQPFTTYENPFANGNDRVWPPEKVLRFTYQAIQAWAKEQGIQMRPDQTPREFCHRLIERFPDFGPELEQFSYYYSHAAFAKQLPDDFEIESIRRLWEYMGDSLMVVSGQ